MMHKITKKLFCYFTALLLFFAAIAFVGFSLVLSHHMYQNHARGLKERAGTIAAQLETFLGAKGPKQGRGAYLRFIDDIAMADAYIIGPDGAPFSYGQHTPSSYGQHAPEAGTELAQASNVLPEADAELAQVSNALPEADAELAQASNALPEADAEPALASNVLPEADAELAQASNALPETVKEFAARVFASGNYEHSREKDGQGRDVFYAGMPVRANGQTVAAAVICDTTDEVQGGLLPAVSVLFGCMLIALILSVFLSALLSRRFVLPIQQIARTAKELAHGNYLATTDVHDPTELGALAAEMDLLAQKLEAARLKSIRLEQMQKDYISNISHELRTPVTVIRSSLEAICDGVVTGEKATQYQRQALAESISLQRLIDDMLELSRLQNRDFPIEKERMDLLLALEDAVRAVRVLAAGKSIRILFEKPESEWQIFGDYGRLRQMFVAALDNAIKYSADGEQILVHTKMRPDAAIISIKDHGCGILPEDMPNIFARFYRGGQGHEKGFGQNPEKSSGQNLEKGSGQNPEKSSGQNLEKGSGLGLAIMKSIGERHSIDVRLESVFGEGTEAIFSLPADALLELPPD